MGQEMGIKRLAGLENAVNEMQEFTHDSDDNFEATQTTLGETERKGAEKRVMVFGGNSGHI